MNEKPWPVLRSGSAGDPVPALQLLLSGRGHAVVADGIFGARTEAAVRAFQQERRLEVDGIAGPRTWSALLVTVSRGSRGDAVRAVQEELNAGLHAMEPAAVGLAVDGVFGPATDRRVRALQQTCRIAVDGIVGPMTWRALVNHEDLAWI